MIPCPQCARHIRIDAEHCPFCGATRHGTVAAATLALVLGVAACGPAQDGIDGGTTTTGTGSTSATTASSSATTSIDTSAGTSGPITGTTWMTDGTTSTGVNDDGDDAPCAFYGCACCDFGEPPVFECDLWAQDCPVGEKCMPWANDGGPDWNASRCSAVAPDPGAAGSPCMVEGSAVSGMDDCAAGTMCWNVDPDTNMGTCAAMCQGSEQAPLCTDPATMCVIAYGGAINLCLRTCDPMAPMCADGEQCVALRSAFVCAPV